jgi:twitching motility protein PilT
MSAVEETRLEETLPRSGVTLVEFVDWLREVVEADGSDLHLKVDSPPLVRERGRLRRLSRPPLSAEEMESLADVVVPPSRKARFEDEGEVDFAHAAPGVGRFRVNVFRQRGAVSMVLRRLRMGGPTFEEAKLPQVVERLAAEPRGLVLVTGPTGSGKTTTLAAMIDHINTSRPVHIVTIEDPIEVIHMDKTASVNQREVGQDSRSFLHALRAALRQDPDVILIGEMRDAETVQAALQAAETGHLVLSTLHTVDATETVNRILDFFPPQQQQQIRLTLAGALRGILCQRLVPSTDGGRIPCLEVLVNTGRIADRITDPKLTSEIKDVIADGAYYGMRTFDQALLELVSLGDTTIEDAMEAASVPQDLKLMLEQAQVDRAAVSYEKDIKPLFTHDDRMSLKWAFDLWEFSDVNEHAREILSMLEDGRLPLEARWPEQRLTLYRRWVDNPRP